MRNKDYKDDQKVFRFINSGQYYSIRELYTFLKENYLPIKERWVFYFLGRFNYLSESDIAYMEDTDSFGGYFDSEVYFWSCYLQNGEEKRLEVSKEISQKYKDYRIRFDELKKEILKLEHEIKILSNCINDNQLQPFDGEGLLIKNILKMDDLKSEYQHLNNMKLDDDSLNLEIQKKFIEEGYIYVNWAHESLLNIQEKKAIEEYINSNNYGTNFKSDYCEACQESPCRCSDPDPD